LYQIGTIGAPRRSFKPFGLPPRPDGRGYMDRRILKEDER
jgi:hypothetical protein